MEHEHQNRKPSLAKWWRGVQKGRWREVLCKVVRLLMNIGQGSESTIVVNTYLFFFFFKKRNFTPLHKQPSLYAGIERENIHNNNNVSGRGSPDKKKEIVK